MFIGRCSPPPISRTTDPWARQATSAAFEERDLFPPRTAWGLTKIEAEDLLDHLEAAGCAPCQLAYLDGQGFSVRSRSLSA